MKEEFLGKLILKKLGAIFLTILCFHRNFKIFKVMFSYYI